MPHGPPTLLTSMPLASSTDQQPLHQFRSFSPCGGREQE
jgi:hypothetical protein